MLKSLELLSVFTIDELKQVLKTNTLTIKQHLEITAFIDQLKFDFKAIVPPNRDPIKQAENLIASLLNIAKSHGQLLSSDAKEKLDLLSQINPTGESAYLMSEMYAAISTSPILIRINNQVETIISLLNTKPLDQKTVINAYIDLGKIAQEHYPQQELKDIQKNLSASLKSHNTASLPPLDIYVSIRNAKKSIDLEVNVVNNPEEVNMMKQLAAGLEIFTTLLDNERVNAAVTAISKNEKATDSSRNSINAILYESRLSKLIAQMEKAKSLDSRFNKLLDDAAEIVNNKDSPSLKYDLLIELLKTEFKNSDKAHKDRNAVKKLFSKSDFFSFLNTNSNGEHYPRIVGALLREAINLRHTAIGKPEIGKIKINELRLNELELPDTDLYKDMHLVNKTTPGITG